MNDLLPTQKINTVATYGHSNTKKWLTYTNKLMVIIFVGGQLNECKSTPATLIFSEHPNHQMCMLLSETICLIHCSPRIVYLTPNRSGITHGHCNNDLKCTMHFKDCK